MLGKDEISGYAVRSSAGRGSRALDMRILHTSDWHLGHTLHGWSRDHEHERFLTWLIETSVRERVDVLAGMRPESVPFTIEGPNRSAVVPQMGTALTAY